MARGDILEMNDAFSTRRVGMTLYSTPSCIEGHTCRIVLHEKEVECDVEYVNLSDTPNWIAENNPYGESPILIDRDLVLYGSNIIAEYLDDRLPHPPLMPPDPVAKGRVRMMIYRFQRDWLSQLRHLDENKQKPSKQLRDTILRDLCILAPYMSSQDFWLGDEFTLVDCFMGPLLWRLEHFDIQLPSQARSIIAYANRLYRRHSFPKSLSEFERELKIT